MNGALVIDRRIVICQGLSDKIWEETLKRRPRWKCRKSVGGTEIEVLGSRWGWINFRAVGRAGNLMENNLMLLAQIRSTKLLLPGVVVVGSRSLTNRTERLESTSWDQDRTGLRFKGPTDNRSISIHPHSALLQREFDRKRQNHTALFRRSELSMIVPSVRRNQSLSQAMSDCFPIRLLSLLSALKFE